jgi:hypothetical protein
MLLLGLLGLILSDGFCRNGTFFDAFFSHAGRLLPLKQLWTFFLHAGKVAALVGTDCTGRRLLTQGMQTTKGKHLILLEARSI